MCMDLSLGFLFCFIDLYFCVYVVHIHNGILLSYKKEHIWVSSNEVDETGAYYSEWSKSERETPRPYIN